MAAANYLHLFVFKAADGWRWHLKAGNGKIVADSGEAYATKPNANRAARRLRTSVIFMGKQ